MIKRWLPVGLFARSVCLLAFLSFGWLSQVEMSSATEEAADATAADAATPSTDASATRPIDFNRDIRPILSNQCYTCHGPDSVQRKAGLRLDRRDFAFQEIESGAIPIVPGDPSHSALYQRISSTDADERMPPADSGKSLAPAQIELIKRWIEQGADWPPHWSFVAPKRPAAPAVNDTAWPKNAIDNFILVVLEHEGLTPSGEAQRTSLIRRVTLDLTGLPPTLEEIDAFVADQEPDAYERLVDRLLASPRYGEHMARYWLDVARYGDTHGLHLDNERSIWPYRDWVIRSFNQNKPFDQFTVEQMAGDLLPSPSLDQLVATGFNRCNVSTSEGGAIEEEYRVRYAIDRVETMSTVFLGLTTGCAVCHDHKFDPITQKEFYQLFAFFNNVADKAMDGNALDPPPVIRAPTAEQQQQLAAIDAQMAEKQSALAALTPGVEEAERQWRSEVRQQLSNRWAVLKPIRVHSSGGSRLRELEDGSVLAEGINPNKDDYFLVTATNRTGITAIRLEALTDAGLPKNGPGRSENSNFVLSEIELEAASVADPSQKRTIHFVAAQADFSQEKGDFFPSKAIDGDVSGPNGWAVAGYERHEDRTAVFIPDEAIGFEGGTVLCFRLRHQSEFKQHQIGRFRLSVSTETAHVPIALGPWHSIGPFTASDGAEAFRTAYEPEGEIALDKPYRAGFLKWRKRPQWVDGQPHQLEGEKAATYLYRSIYSPESREVELLFGSDDGLKVWLNGQVVLEQDVERAVTPDSDRVKVTLAAGENRLLVKVVNYGGAYAFSFRAGSDGMTSEPLAVAAALALPDERRTPAQSATIQDYFRARMAPEWKRVNDEAEALRVAREALDKQAPVSMVMSELAEPRDCFVLTRGQYDQHGEQVTAGVPAVFPPLAEGVPANRLALARWLVDPSHPLTARVAVNRFWQQCFGAGLVRTPEDFGIQGEWPTHPELLDWLATEFESSGWDVKRMMRLIVTSATYRQDSAVSPALYEKDRDNKLLARGPRFRLDAEVIRDNALAASGLLDLTIGGHSVKPYQPTGIWEAVGYTKSNTANFVQDHGNALYRRSLYTFWKRTAPPPAMVTFDAPSRESCTVNRARTNTPLQALTLMNDTQFVEAARRLAQRMMHEGGSDPAARMTFAFRLITARTPSPAEVRVLAELFAKQLEYYQAHPEEAAQLIAVGESPRDDLLDACELASWTMVASVLLNLDETVTKG